MDIDRAQFLYLVAALSTVGGCSVQTTDGTGGSSSTGVPPGAMGCEALSAHVKGCADFVLGSEACSNDALAQCVLDTGLDVCTVVFHPNQLSAEQLKQVEACGGGPTCLGDVGTPAACSSECEGVSNCTALPFLHAGIAEDVVPCLNALDAATCSNASDAYQTCLLGSLAKGCKYATSAPLCGQIATGCSGSDSTDWEQQCSDRINGLTDMGLARIQGCMSSTCKPGDDLVTQMDTCMLGLFGP